MTATLHLVTRMLGPGPPASVPARSRGQTEASVASVSRHGGSGSSGPARRDRDRAAGGWSRSAPRSGAAPSGTPPAVSAPWRRQIGVGGLPAPAGARRCHPGRDCLRREPHGQAAAGAQGGIILGPVGHPVPLLRNVMAASGIRFERQEECPCRVEGTRPGLTLP